MVRVIKIRMVRVIKILMVQVIKIPMAVHMAVHMAIIHTRVLVLGTILECMEVRMDLVNTECMV